MTCTGQKFWYTPAPQNESEKIRSTGQPDFRIGPANRARMDRQQCQLQSMSGQ